MFATFVMVSVAFGALMRDVRGGLATGFPVTTTAAFGTTTYGPGVAVTGLWNATEATEYSNFRRWDGVWQPYSTLNLTSGNWPYLLNQTATSFTATRQGLSFTQGKVPGATYAYWADRIKETIRIDSSFPKAVASPSVYVSFATAYLPVVRGSSVSLYDLSGGLVWTTAPFTAWDSSSTQTQWTDAVTSVQSATGGFNLFLNTTVSSMAVYPLYIDPTWTLGGGAGWGASTFANATTDLGDGSVKIGTFADDFNNNAASGWSISGTVTFSGGTMNLGSGGSAWPSGSWGNLNLQFDAKFASGSSKPQPYLFAYFCTGCTTSGSLKIDQYHNQVTLTVGAILGQFSPGISLNAWYTARVVAQGTHFEVWWNGVRRISATAGVTEGTGGIKYSAFTATTISMDNVRVWNANAGSITTPVRDAGTYRPAQTWILGAVDAYNEAHIQVRSGTSGSLSGPWTTVKADVAGNVPYNEPNQTALEFYQLQITLTSGTNATPTLTQISTVESGPPSFSAAGNTGFQPWYPFVGGMANLANGNLFLSATDLAFQGKGLTLALTRSYNSRIAGQRTAFGLGWTLGYAQNLTFNPNGNVTWNGPDGASFLFVAKGTTAGFSPPAGVPGRLTKNGDGTYTLATADGASERFSVAGALVSVSDRNGNQLTLSYSGGTPSRLTRVSDSTGKALTFSYDGSNRINKVTDPAGRTATYAYDASSDLLSETDPLGNVASYGYASGRLATIVDPVGKGTQVSYFTSGIYTGWVAEIDVGLYENGAFVWRFPEDFLSYRSSLRTVTDARGYDTSVTLNTFGNVAAISGPALGCSCDSAGNSSSYLWDGEMNRLSTTDGRQDTRSVTYGFRGNALTVTDPGGNVSSRTWLEANNATNYFVVPASSTTARGFTTTMAYDGKGNLLSVTDPGGNRTTHAYDANGFLNKTVSARGYTAWSVYNASGWLVKTTDPMNDATQDAYDGLGRPTSVTDPMGFVTTTAYDADGRVANVTDPLGHVTSYGYDARGDPTNVTDADRLRTTYAFNVTNGKTEAQTDAGGNTTAFAYDLRGNLVSLRDANGHSTMYAYDAFDRLTSTTTPLGYTTTYVYDAAGNRIARTDGNGHTTRYAYDKLNRLMATMYPGPPVYLTPQTLTYAYDKDGNLVFATGFGFTETRTYDKSGRLASSVLTYPGSPGFTSTLQYTYDPDGNIHTTTVQDGSTSPTTRFYDAVDRLTGILDGTSNTTYAYDRDSRQVGMSEPNGVAQTTLYDRAGRTTYLYTNKTGANLETINYTYDAASFRTYTKDVAGSATTTTALASDLEHRLRTTSVQDSVHGSSSTEDTWDAVGNLVQEVAFRTQTYRYDADNELYNMTSSTGYWITYEYDYNGNQIAWQDSLHELGSMSYDYENRMIVDGGCAYTYTPTGERASDSCNTGAPNERYDAARPASASDLVVQYNATGVREDRYVSSSTDQPVEMVSGTSNFWYARDGLGSVKRLTDAGGNTAETYAYDPWGAATPSGSVANPFEFTARPLDSSGLYDYRARRYDPTSNGGHRFTSSDPLGGGYAYAGDSPANFVDPTGMLSVPYHHGRSPGVSPAPQSPIAPAPSGEHFSWDRCWAPLAIYLLTTLAMFLGWDPSPVVASIQGGAVLFSGVFTTFAPDIRSLGESRNDPLAFAFAIGQFFVDAMFFIWTTFIQPYLDFWAGLLIGGELAGDAIPGVLEVKIGLAVASLLIGATIIASINCFPGE